MILDQDEKIQIKPFLPWWRNKHMTETLYNGYMSGVNTVNSSLKKKNVHVEFMAILTNK